MNGPILKKPIKFYEIALWPENIYINAGQRLDYGIASSELLYNKLP